MCAVARVREVFVALMLVVQCGGPGDNATCICNNNNNSTVVEAPSAWSVRYGVRRESRADAEPFR